MPDASTDLLLTAVVAPTVSGLVLFFIGLFVGRRLERKDRWRADDRTRIYEPLYAQIRKLLLSEAGGQKGFSLNTPDTEVIDGIMSLGLLVPLRHRFLKPDLEKLSSLTTGYQQASWDFNIAANKALDRVSSHNVDLKSDTVLFNAVLTSNTDAGSKRVEELLTKYERILLQSGASAYEMMFESVLDAVKVARATLFTARDNLLIHGKLMKVRLEPAFRSGSYG